MPIPSQNDFLLPFLTLLSHGKTYTRSQVLDGLAKHFSLGEAELNQLSGSQFTIINRVAWCDAHFVRAGFVAKTQHPTDSLQDTFHITSLGVRELGRQGHHGVPPLTVGYLQSFYRGKVLRGAGSDDTTSEAELALYTAFEKLPDEFTVLHSVKWFSKSEKGTVGEVDFLIVHPQLGVLVLEVKGGVVSMEQRGNQHVWTTVNYFGKAVEIKDPCHQADRNRRALREWLQTDPRTRNIPFALFPSVALPDSQLERDLRPDCPAAIFLDIRHVADVERRIHEIFAYWQPRADGANQRMGGAAAVKALVELLVPTRALQPRVAEIFERERRKIEELTHNQFRILRQLKHHKRAAIIGGSGTGKTMLAMEKAAQLAEGGFRVLFLCFNRELSDWVGANLKHELIMVATYHQFVGTVLHWAGVKRTAYASWNDFVTDAPDLLLDAVSIIRSPDSGQQHRLFDAIIVDEAQDFGDTWWVALPDFLVDPDDGVFYVFFDDNQRIFTQISSIPMGGEPFLLDENCRNTQHIHAALSPYMREVEETVCDGPEGRPVEIIPAADRATARRELQRVLHRLVNEEGIKPSEIIVLTPAADKRSGWKENDQLGNFVLTWDMDTEMRDAIRVCTIYRYKGLESAVVILTELDQRREEVGDSLIYVGLSRARHHAIVIGALPKPSGEVS
ncbi:MAG: NERD domain-containing protein [Chloroflexi bacterium]|nr:NERD domain-containing protein [Chloroflexota bacterium]